MADSLYRHELKYDIDAGTYLALRQRLKTIMRPDPHAGPDGRYSIRSVYFDNVDDRALREKLIGAPRREKFRIRWYNDDLSHIVLEKKQKIDELCVKCEAPISETECRAILQGPAPWMMEHPNTLVRELYCKMTSQRLRPRVTVSYTREPYVYSAGNVRVTFDSDVRTSLWSRSFLDGAVPDVSALDAAEQMLLEVKYDAFLPDVIALLLQSEGVRRTAFSKYAACRRFG